MLGAGTATRPWAVTMRTRCVCGGEGHSRPSVLVPVPAVCLSSKLHSAQCCIHLLRPHAYLSTHTTRQACVRSPIHNGTTPRLSLQVVLHAVRDDLDDPLAVVLRNARHEAKLKDWAEMDALDK